MGTEAGSGLNGGLQKYSPVESLGTCESKLIEKKDLQRYN